jgi:hypothetical protein
MTAEWVPKEQIEAVLNREFVTPFIDCIRREPMISLKLSNAFVLLHLSEQLIIEFDKKQVQAGNAVEAVRQKTLFLGYLGKIYQSALLLIGATDYLRAIILFRSVFELVIGIATAENGSMRDRILSINALNSDEKSALQKLWNELSAWAHPYGRWSKNICPKFYGIGRNHHSVIFGQCLGYSDQILDLMLTITIDHLKLHPEGYLDKYRAITETTKIMEISALPMFEKRLARSS